MHSLDTVCGKKLREPIEVLTFEVDGHFYASSPSYKIFADASSSDDAMINFIEQLEDMYIRYTKLQDLIE
jgi:uncharacterized ParB-like nuclease family protein